MQRKFPVIGAVLASCLAAPAMAAQPQPLTYEAFEMAVPHIDLEACPAGMGGENTFCRATLNHEEFHVFAFSDDGDQPFLAMRSYPLDGIEALFD